MPYRQVLELPIDWNEALILCHLLFIASPFHAERYI